jgi:small-conductance mechanosensitive channel
MRAWIEATGRYGRVDRTLTATLINSVIALLPFLPIYWALQSLTFSKPIAAAIHFAFTLLFTFGVVRFFANLATFLIDTILRGNSNDDSASGKGAGALMPIVRTIVWALGLTFLLDNLGFQISSIVAGLGIMGVAVGLAGQAILADFFSYLVILMDRPFSLGDSVTFGQVSGAIEHVGVKTTRIRSNTGELIICPNADMTKQIISNFQAASTRTRVISFGVAYETPLEKLRRIPDMVREVAERIPRLVVNRVHFTTFGDSSLNFEVSFSLSARNLAPLLDAQQALNIGIMERFEQEGIVFAYPTQTVYMAGQGGDGAKEPPQSESALSSPGAA